MKTLLSTFLLVMSQQSFAGLGGCPVQALANQKDRRMIQFLEGMQGSYQLGSCYVEIQTCNSEGTEEEKRENIVADMLVVDKDGFERYILPPQRITAVISAPVMLAGSDNGFCAALDQQSDSLTDDMAAVRVKYSLANNVMDSVLSFQTANLVPGQNSGATYPVRFMPAQIAESTLVVSNPDSLSYAGRVVLKVNFPGHKSASTNIAAEDPNATFIIKLFVDAKIKTADFLRNVSNVIQKGKFQRREFTEDVITGGLEGSINISLDDKGKDYDLMRLMTNPEEDDRLLGYRCKFEL